MKKRIAIFIILLACFILVCIFYQSRPEPHYLDSPAYFENQLIEQHLQAEADSAARGYEKLGISPDSVWIFTE